MKIRNSPLRRSQMIFISALVIIASLLFFYKGLLPKEKINAAEEIIVNKDKLFPYKLPPLSTTNYEEGWQSVANGGFIQNGPSYQLDYVKEKVNTPKHMTSRANDFVSSVTPLANEKFLIVQWHHNIFEDSGAGANKVISRSRVTIVNKEGKIVRSTDGSLATRILSSWAIDAPQKDDLGVNRAQYSEAPSEPISLGNGNYKIIYSGVVYGYPTYYPQATVTFNIDFAKPPTWGEVDKNGVTIADVRNKSVLLGTVDQMYLYGRIYNGTYVQKKVPFNAHPVSKAGKLTGTQPLKIPTFFTQDLGFPNLPQGVTSRFVEIENGTLGYYNNRYFGMTEDRHKKNSGTQNWDMNSKILTIWNATTGNTEIESGANQTGDSAYMLKEISTDKYVYVALLNQTHTQIIKYDLSKTVLTSEDVVRLPKNTRITIVPNVNTDLNTNFTIFGSIESAEGIFSDIKPGAIVGNINNLDDFELKTLSNFVTEKYTEITNLKDTGNNQVFTVGMTLDNKFSDFEPGYLAKDPVLSTSSEKYYYPFFGTLKLDKNYSPGISFPSNNQINIKDKNIEKKLLEGVKVTDTYDLSPNNIAGQKTQEWLNNRINHNALDPNIDDMSAVDRYPIDWKSLGLIKEFTGPQIITYYIADSTNQATSAERWINKKTPQTIIKDDFAIDAQNFTMPLTDVGTLVNDLVKRKAKSMAWNLETHVIDEDTSKDPAVLSNKVTINQGQLAAIQGATVAKPYPLELTYQTANGPIVNKIWVFVTDDQTTVEEDKELVMYGLDHSVAQHLAKDQTNALAIDKDHGSVRVYDLNDAVNKGVAVTDLPPIAGVQADGTVLAGYKLIADVPQLTAIKNATVQQGKDNTEYPLKVTFDNGISVDLTVTVVAKQAELTIKFQDADSKTVYFEADGVTPKADLVYTEIVGDKFLASSIKDRPEVSAVITKVLTEGYPSLNGYDPTEEIEISKDDTTYIFKFNGAVELTKVTPKMTFETGVVWIRDQTLFYESAEDFLLTVRDTRQSTGATEGEKLRGKFSVNAKLATNFIHDTVANAILKDAQIVYFNGTKDVILSLDGGAQEVIKNTASSTDKNFEIMLDDKGQAKNNLRLEIPDSGILEGTYNASIEWDLIQGP